MKKSGILILVCIAIMLCGCNGYREINNGYIVTAIGFYKSEDETCILVEALSSSDMAEEKTGRVVLNSKGEDLNLAYENLKSRLVKPLYFEQIGAAVFDNNTIENMSFLKEITDINYGIYIVQSDDTKALFEEYPQNEILGYDIISLIKTSPKGNKIKNQLYQLDGNYNLPTVNLIEGNLMFK